MIEFPDAFAQALREVLPGRLARRRVAGTLLLVSYRCERCGGEVELERTPLESGLVRLATLGAGGVPARVRRSGRARSRRARARPLPTRGRSCAGIARRCVRSPTPAGARCCAAEDDELDLLAVVWRPRALALAGRADELSRGDVVRGRLEQRVAEVAARMQVALAAGEDDEAERLHARAIELGTVLAGRLAAEWRA